MQRGVISSHVHKVGGFRVTLSCGHTEWVRGVQRRQGVGLRAPFTTNCSACDALTKEREAMNTQFIAELSDQFGVISRKALRALEAPQAKREASMVFGDTYPHRTITLLERQGVNGSATVRPLAARSTDDRRDSDWVDYA